MKQEQQKKPGGKRPPPEPPQPRARDRKRPPARAAALDMGEDTEGGATAFLEHESDGEIDVLPVVEAGPLEGDEGDEEVGLGDPTAPKKERWRSPVYKAHMDSPKKGVFLIGRIMAYAEAIHAMALAGDATSAIGKNVQKASTSPQSRWPKVSSTVQRSYTKVMGNPRSQKLARILMANYMEMLQELTEIPDHLDLDEQSSFWLGWYDGVRAVNYHRFRNAKLDGARKPGAAASAAAAPN